MSFLYYFHSTISNHMSVAVPMWHGWTVANNMFNCSSDVYLANIYVYNISKGLLQIAAISSTNLKHTSTNRILHDRS